MFRPPSVANPLYHCEIRFFPDSKTAWEWLINLLLLGFPGIPPACSRCMSKQLQAPGAAASCHPQQHKKHLCGPLGYQGMRKGACDSFPLQTAHPWKQHKSILPIAQCHHVWMEYVLFAEEFKLMGVTFWWLAPFSHKSTLCVSSTPLRDTLYISDMKTHQFGVVLEF